MGELPSWHEQSFRNLSALAKQDSLPHGLLLVGHKGDGAGFFSSELVRLLLCLNPTDNACGTCKACALSVAGHHPDFMHIEPEGKSMTIKVDAIRQMTKKVSETAQQGGNKVIYIESAQKMNTNAANALLKVLEEPTDNTFILLETNQLGQTLPTVRSRCRIVQLAKPTLAQSTEYLATKGIQVDTTIALGIANQRPIDALSLQESQIASWFEVEEQFLKNPGFVGLSQFVANSLGRIKADDFLNLLLDAFRFRSREIDLVEHCDDLVIVVERLINIGQRLGFNPLGGIHHQQ